MRHDHRDHVSGRYAEKPGQISTTSNPQPLKTPSDMDWHKAAKDNGKGYSGVACYVIRRLGLSMFATGIVRFY